MMTEYLLVPAVVLVLVELELIRRHLAGLVRRTDLLIGFFVDGGELRDGARG